MDAIVLAGGKTSREMRIVTGVTNRAMVELSAGRTMLDYILAALAESKSVGRVFVVGDVPPQGGVTLVAPGESLLDNLILGLDAAGVGSETSALMVSSDIPFITGPAIDDFVAAALIAAADFCYPIIPMERYNREFAGMKRTTLKLAEGEFTGGNVMLVNAGFLLANRDAVKQAYAARKSVLRLGRMLGLSLLARILVSQLIAPSLLNVPTLEAGVARIVGGSVRGIVTPHPSLGTDVDKPEDVEFARMRLAGN
jgi:GTP:adenosylcobinamide-phosphate guanylyltransferase